MDNVMEVKIGMGMRREYGLSGLLYADDLVLHGESGKSKNLRTLVGWDFF